MAVIATVMDGGSFLPFLEILFLVDVFIFLRLI
jgi:hypothetical protein